MWCDSYPDENNAFFELNEEKGLVFDICPLFVGGTGDSCTLVDFEVFQVTSFKD